MAAAQSCQKSLPSSRLVLRPQLEMLVTSNPAICSNLQPLPHLKASIPDVPSLFPLPVSLSSLFTLGRWLPLIYFTREVGAAGNCSRNLFLSLRWTCLHLQLFFFLFLLLLQNTCSCSPLNWIVLSTSVDPMLFCLLRIFLDYFFFILYLLPLSTFCFSTFQY